MIDRIKFKVNYHIISFNLTKCLLTVIALTEGNRNRTIVKRIITYLNFDLLSQVMKVAFQNYKKHYGDKYTSKAFGHVWDIILVYLFPFRLILIRKKLSKMKMKKD